MKIVKNVFFFVLSFFLFGFSFLFASEKTHFIQSREDFFPRCFISESNFHRLPKPKKFHPNNNLLKKSNKNIYALGQKMILEGYIVDENCVPIQNAVVKIWQKNNFGIYQNGFNSNLINGSAYEIQKKINRYNQFFIGNGSVTTDNLGYFHFITLIPCADSGSSSKCVPEIEISVESNSKTHSGFEGRTLIPELDRISKKKLVLLNKHGYPDEYIADLKEINKNYLRFKYDICLEGRNKLRKH